MRKTTSVALVSLCLALINTSSISALSIGVPTTETGSDTDLVSRYYTTSIAAYSDPLSQVETPQGEEIEKVAVTPPAAIKAPAKKAAPKVTTHTVKTGETLIEIGDEYKADWQRIYAKNKKLENPDVLKLGIKLVIPEESEKITLRELPQLTPNVAPVAIAAAPTQTTTYTAPQPTQAVVPAYTTSSAGNTYYAGYCTWYSKSRRPDLPNNLGNADTWAAQASGQGIATGSAPRVGAIAQATVGFMHVAYVEAVNGDGTITVSEMNYQGFGVVSTRTAPASEFTYIY